MFESGFIRKSLGKAAVVSALALAAFTPAASQAAPGAAAAPQGGHENIYGRVSAVHGNTVDIQDSRGFVSHVRYGSSAVFAPGYQLRTGSYVRVYGYNGGPYFSASFIAPFAAVGFGYGPAYAYAPYYGCGPYYYGCSAYYGPAITFGAFWGGYYGYRGYYGYGWRGGYPYYGGWRGGYYGGGWHGGYGGGWHGGYGGGGWHGGGYGGGGWHGGGYGGGGWHGGGYGGGGNGGGVGTHPGFGGGGARGGGGGGRR